MNEHLSPHRVLRIVALLLFGVAATRTASAFFPTFFSLPEGRPGCDTPIRWRLGDVDPRFPLGEKDFLRAIFEAEAIWERQLGTDLFLYDPSADFVVTTEFDGRQEMTYDSRTLEERIAEYEETAGTLSARYEALRDRYERDTAALRTRIDAFERDLREYDRDVSRVNRSGGADPDEYEALEDRKEDLEKEQSAITAEADRLDAVVADINALADRLNAETETVNGQVTDFRETYGEPEPFVQGLYDPESRSITVYQFEHEEDLRLVLAHEFGHALGIDDHVEDDPSALMYFLMDGQDILDPHLRQGDIDAYRTACPARAVSTREILVSYLVETPWEDIRFDKAYAILSGGEK